MQAVVVPNDDYCDDITFGRDENSTSACSFFQTEANFLCTVDGFNTFNLPNSRVHDGNNMYATNRDMVITFLCVYMFEMIIFYRNM